MLFKSLFLAALLIGVSAAPVDGTDGSASTSPTPSTGSTISTTGVHAADATKLKAPALTKTRSELAAAILSIMLHNRVGGVPVQCMSHKTFDALICNFPSLLADATITSGIDEVKNMGLVGFENIQYVAKTQKGNTIIKWGFCKSRDGTPQTWNAALGLTRIFGGKSCTILHLSIPPPAMQEQAKVAQAAVQNLIKDAKATVAAGGTTGGTTGGATGGTASTDSSSTASTGSGGTSTTGWTKGADGKWTKPG